jgi:hypothetical protein
MPKQYCLAALLLCTVGVPIAEADQSNNQSTDSGKGSANQAEVSAIAQVTDQPMFKFGGFGSLGVSHSSLNSADYIVDSTMPKGAGRSNDWAFGNNTRITAHVAATFTPKISAILQIDSEYQSDGTYRPDVEWLSAKYAFTPNLHLSVGRIALPTFMDSENRDIGYSYTWVNPPVDLYQQLSVPSSDGAEIKYRSEMGEAGNTVKVISGRNTTERPTTITTSRNILGIFDTLEYGQTMFHLGYQQRQSSTENTLTGVTGIWKQNSDISVGANYDPGNWFLMSEWIQRRSTYKSSAMYVSAGYRINKFTPYLTHSQNSSGSFFLDSSPPTATEQQLANRSQSTNSVGVRWDFMRDFDFKIQYDRITISDNSNGYLINVPTNLILYGTTFHVINAVVDFVF